MEELFIAETVRETEQFRDVLEDQELHSGVRFRVDHYVEEGLLPEEELPF